MYSMVLAMALSGGAATPADHGCFGGGGCHGVVSYGCWGGSSYGYNGCWTSCNGYNGCHGGRGLFGRLFNRRGCHGCSGGYTTYGCSGCSGGYTTYGCHGCSGGYTTYGCHGGAGMPAPMKEAVPPPKKGGGSEEASTTRSAILIVSLPAEATLTIDGNATTSTAATRVFRSPELVPGVDYVYTLKAEVTREGQPLAVSKEVTVRAGQESRVTLEFPAASVTQR